MIIECINCDIRYNIDDSRFNTPQKKVKCSKCGEVFIVSKENDPFESLKPETKAPDSDSNASDKLQDHTPPVSHEIKDEEPEVFQKSSENNNSHEQVKDVFTPPEEIDEEINAELENTDTDNELEVSFEDTQDDEEINHKDDAFNTSLELDIKEDSNGFSSSDQKNEEKFDDINKESMDDGDTLDDNFDSTAVEEHGEPESMELIDWENLEIDDLQKNVSTEAPQTEAVTSEEKPEDNLDLEDNEEYKEKGFKKQKPETEKVEKSPFQSSLAPDFSDNMSDYNRASDSSGGGPSGGEYAAGSVSQNPYVPSSRKKRSFVSRLFINFLYLIALTIVFTAVMFSLVIFDVVPQDKFAKYIDYASPYLPALDGEDQKKFDNLSITGLKGKWVNTKNGYMYVVYGEVINNDKKPVNYIKLRSTFQSAGSDLYEQEFYSGNTLTLKELQNKSSSQLKQKLNRREGDVDFQDVSTFAGRNFNIEPGQAVPFYTFFLSGKKILGLKYDVEVVDFQTNSN